MSRLLVLILSLWSTQELFAQALPTEELRAGVPEGLPGITVVEGKFVSELLHGEILNCVLAKTGLKMHWRAYPTKRLLEMLEWGDLDVIYPMGFSVERSLTMQPSSPAITLSDYWIYRGNTPDFSDKANLRVGAKDGSPQHKWLSDQNYQQIKLPQQYSSLLPMLEAGRIDAVLLPAPGSDIKSLKQYGRMRPDYKTVLQSERNVGFYLGLGRRPDILKAINNALLTCHQ